ncbi:MAG: hypothetical protein PHD15_04020 [Clostridia bacterium]|nr:hypothetical protein [Clostridia bacterium]MDD4386907.1 hypothetical protein [Clostridia bacterium]
MEELMIKLKEIKEDINEIEQVTEIIRRETSILEYFDRIDKEVS